MQVYIIVQDTGCGIATEQHELIFDPFNQVSACSALPLSRETALHHHQWLLIARLVPHMPAIMNKPGQCVDIWQSLARLNLGGLKLPELT